MHTFTDFVKEYKLLLPENFLSKIQEFCELLLEANKNTNLVSKNDEQKLLTRHVADSLIFAAYLNNEKYSQLNWADIGSGAGFPVIPLSLYFPHIKFFAVECRKKRSEFLNFAKQKLNLRNLEVIHGSAGTHGNDSLQNMDFVSCRAVGSLEEDWERAKKILKKGGIFLTVKSKRIIDEMPPVKGMKIWNYRLPGEKMEYALAHIKNIHSQGT